MLFYSIAKFNFEIMMGVWNKVSTAHTTEPEEIAGLEKATHTGVVSSM